MAYQVEQVQRSEAVTAVVVGRVPEEAIGEFVGTTLGEVMQALSAQGLTPTGAPFVRYFSPPPQFDLEAGIPCSGPVVATGRVMASTLPGGTVLRLLHHGAYSEVGAAYQALEEHMAAHGLTPAGAPWESYLDGPEVEVPRTVIEWPVA